MRISIVLTIFVWLTVFLSGCGNAYASYPDPGAVEIGSSLISPASPLYFLKAVREKIELRMADGNLKVVATLEFAQRRLREVNSLIKTGHQDLIEPTVEQYKNSMAQVHSMASNNVIVKVMIAESSARHLDILQRFYDSVGYPRAKMSIMSAIMNAEEYNRKVISGLELEAQQKLIKNIALRQAVACEFLAREASSAAEEPQKQLLLQKVKACQEDVNTTLKDQLDELRQK